MAKTMKSTEDQDLLFKMKKLIDIASIIAVILLAIFPHLAMDIADHSCICALCTMIILSHPVQCFVVTSGAGPFP